MTSLRGLIPLCALLVACGRGTQPTPTIGDDASMRTGTPEGWPRVLVVTAGEGPALFLGPESDSPPIGYLSSGVRLRLDGPPVNGRVPVTVAGGMQARGWAQLGRVGLYVTHRGRLDGTPSYVAVGDLVGVTGRTDDGQWRIRVAPWMGREELDRLGPFDATVAADGLTDTAPAGPDAELNAGENRLLPVGTEVPVYDRPGGAVVARIPATDTAHTVVVLRSRGGWNGIRAGVGPYLVGYVQGELAAADAAPQARWTTPTAGADGIPARIAGETGSLHRLAEGTRIRFLDRVIAVARRGAWARELGRVSGGRADVYVAVDDGCALRGLVREDDLLSAEGAATPPASAAPAEPMPAGPSGS
jgi:hypothetical protein